MERVIKKSNSGEISANGIIIYSTDNTYIGRNEKELLEFQWKIIKPEYYRYLDDNTILEIWYDGIGMLLSGSIKGHIDSSWSREHREEINYEQAMEILRLKNERGYCNKDLMSRVENELEKENNPNWVNWGLANSGANAVSMDYVKIEDLGKLKQNNNGGATDYYTLPKDANTLQDLIEHRNMNGSVKDIFKACYRLGIKTEDELRDLNKMAYYSLREIGRITGRKDYITIAKELMGSQSVEKD